LTTRLPLSFLQSWALLGLGLWGGAPNKESLLLNWDLVGIL